VGLGVQPDRAGHGFPGRRLAQVGVWAGRNVCINRGRPGWRRINAVVMIMAADRLLGTALDTTP
jgi:hypothetical protein